MWPSGSRKRRSLYREALDTEGPTEDPARRSEFLITVFPEKTPDGASFQVSAIERALEDL